MKSGIRRDVKEREKFERRILEELMRVFTETDSFYFCAGPPGSREADLTNCLQKQHSERSDTDDRFFWNRFMLKDIIDLNVCTIFNYFYIVLKDNTTFHFTMTKS